MHTRIFAAIKIVFSWIWIVLCLIVSLPFRIVFMIVALFDFIATHVVVFTAILAIPLFAAGVGIYTYNEVADTCAKSEIFENMKIYFSNNTINTVCVGLIPVVGFVLLSIGLGKISAIFSFVLSIEEWFDDRLEDAVDSIVSNRFAAKNGKLLSYAEKEKERFLNSPDYVPRLVWQGNEIISQEEYNGVTITRIKER